MSHLSYKMDSLEEFGIYLQYARKLGFEETPDYDFLRDLFDKVLEKSNETDDGIYDWMMLNNGKGWEVRYRLYLFIHVIHCVLTHVLLDNATSIINATWAWCSCCVE